MRIAFLALWLGIACRTPTEPPAAPPSGSEVAPSAAATSNRSETGSEGASSGSATSDRFETVSGVVRNMAYSIRLPTGATRSSSMTNDRWRVVAGDFTFNLLIDRDPGITYEDHVANQNRPVVRSERVAHDVWAFAFEHPPPFDGAMRELSVIARVGTLFCRGHLRGRSSGADVIAGVQELEAMCLSLSTK